jgi:hypothetical protein
LPSDACGWRRTSRNASNTAFANCLVETLFHSADMGRRSAFAFSALPVQRLLANAVDTQGLLLGTPASNMN